MLSISKVIVAGVPAVLAVQAPGSKKKLYGKPGSERASLPSLNVTGHSYGNSRRLHKQRPETGSSTSSSTISTSSSERLDELAKPKNPNPLVKTTLTQLRNAPVGENVALWLDDRILHEKQNPYYKNNRNNVQAKVDSRRRPSNSQGDLSDRSKDPRFRSFSFGAGIAKAGHPQNEDGSPRANGQTLSETLHEVPQQQPRGSLKDRRKVKRGATTLPGL